MAEGKVIIGGHREPGHPGEPDPRLKDPFHLGELKIRWLGEHPDEKPEAYDTWKSNAETRRVANQPSEFEIFADRIGQAIAQADEQAKQDSLVTDAIANAEFAAQPTWYRNGSAYFEYSPACAQVYEALDGWAPMRNLLSGAEPPGLLEENRAARDAAGHLNSFSEASFFGVNEALRSTDKALDALKGDDTYS